MVGFEEGQPRLDTILELTEPRLKLLVSHQLISKTSCMIFSN